MASGIVQAAGLFKIYPQGPEEIIALDRLDLTVERGEFLIITGESGSGKTTLLNLVGGLDTLSAGSLLVDGCDLVSETEENLSRFRRERIGFVFQDFRLVRHLTALANVILPLVFSGRYDRGDDARRLLIRFGLRDRLGHLPADLSRGEMQRVALARALVNRPRLLLADEPTGNLDMENGERIWDHLQELHRNGNLTMIATTHDARWQERADRLVTLRNGRIIADRRPLPAA